MPSKICSYGDLVIRYAATCPEHVSTCRIPVVHVNGSASGSDAICACPWVHELGQANDTDNDNDDDSGDDDHDDDDGDDDDDNNDDDEDDDTVLAVIMVHLKSLLTANKGLSANLCSTT